MSRDTTGGAVHQWKMQSPGARALSDAPLTSQPSLLSTKVKASHLERLAVVYVRQSTQQQVLEHEATRAFPRADSV